MECCQVNYISIKKIKRMPVAVYIFVLIHQFVIKMGAFYYIQVLLQKINKTVCLDEFFSFKHRTQSTGAPSVCPGS